MEEIVTTHVQQQSLSPKKILFRIIPVTVHNQGKSIKTYAFLDEGSSVTLVEETLADELKVTGSPDRLCLKWTGDTIKVETNSKKISFHISSQLPNAKKYRLNCARTTQDLNLPTQSIQLTKLHKYYHLRGLPVEEYLEATPKILIGLDNWHAAAPLRIEEGGSCEPIALKRDWVGLFRGHTQTMRQMKIATLPSVAITSVNANTTIHCKNK